MQGRDSMRDTAMAPQQVVPLDGTRCSESTDRTPVTQHRSTVPSISQRAELNCTKLSEVEQCNDHNCRIMSFDCKFIQFAETACSAHAKTDLNISIILVDEQSRYYSVFVIKLEYSN